MKHTKGPWKISKNTDSVDIDNKCLGLSPRRASIPTDVADHIHSNRGLHIQIRHNKDPQAFAQAKDLSALISAAPEMLEALESTIAAFNNSDDYDIKEITAVTIGMIESAIKKAKGQ